MIQNFKQALANVAAQGHADVATQVTNSLEMPQRSITRARTKRLKEALLNMTKTNYLEGFEEGFVEGEMEGIGHTTYACMTIVVHED